MLLVTTPRRRPSGRAVLAGNFAQQNGMKVTGVIENMSYFVCPSCDERHQIFGSGGGETLAGELGTTLLGQIPIDAPARGRRHGKPLVVSDPDAPASRPARGRGRPPAPAPFAGRQAADAADLSRRARPRRFGTVDP